MMRARSDWQVLQSDQLILFMSKVEFLASKRCYLRMLDEIRLIVKI